MSFASQFRSIYCIFLLPEEISDALGNQSVNFKYLSWPWLCLKPQNFSLKFLGIRRKCFLRLHYGKLDSP